MPKPNFFVKLMSVACAGLLITGCSPIISITQETDPRHFSHEGGEIMQIDPLPSQMDSMLTPLPLDVEDLLVPMDASNKGSLSGATPAYDFAVKSGTSFPLTVKAPSDAEVSVTVNGKTYDLKATTSKNGIGTFTGSYKMPSVEGTKNLGTISYSMQSNGSTSTLESEGQLFAVGENATLRVKAKNMSATTFKNPKTKATGYVTTLKKGAIDGVTEYYQNMYRLSSVGWVDASAVTPLEENVTLNNKVSSVTFEKNGREEIFTLHGTTHPPYVAVQTQSGLSITLPRTSGVESIPTAESTLFSNAKVTTKGEQTTITFQQANAGELWGYMVEYGNGNTNIICRRRPKLAEGDQPLAGIVVAVDPGHGGSDHGAAGLGGGGRGLVEKQINLMAANVLKNQLQELGAKVVMTRTDDAKVTLSQRLEFSHENRADFFISLHCNSAGNNASGVEVYYYDGISQSLARNISSQISANTGRKNRGNKYSCYVVTLNSFAPSVLVEMGFMTNASDYADMQSQEGMEQNAKAICDSILAELR